MIRIPYILGEKEEYRPTFTAKIKEFSFNKCRKLVRIAEYIEQ